jgi:antitoxin HigA-1
MNPTRNTRRISVTLAGLAAATCCATTRTGGVGVSAGSARCRTHKGLGARRVRRANALPSRQLSLRERTEMAQVRIPSDRPPTPPGEMLLEEFIRPLGMTQAELADRIGVSYVRLNEIVNSRRGITPSTALRLAKALGTTPQFWLNGQLAADLYRVSHDEEELRQLERIEPVPH